MDFLPLKSPSITNFFRKYFSLTDIPTPRDAVASKKEQVLKNPMKKVTIGQGISEDILYIGTPIN